MTFLVLTKRLDSMVLNLRLRRTKWRRYEYVDDEGDTHVILRRSVHSGVEEVFADPDQVVAIIDDRDPESRRKLAEARVEADLRVRQTNYRRPV
jgi:hypothetical protein